MGSASEVRFVPAPTGPGFSFLSWDTEGGPQTKLNLLRNYTGSVFQVETGGQWMDVAPYVLGTETADGSTTVRLGTAGKTELLWKVQTNERGMVWSVQHLGGADTSIAALRVLLPFNPVMAATTVLPSRWSPPTGFCLPAILSAADFGQLLIRQQGGTAVTGTFTGDRGSHVIDVSFTIPVPAAGDTVALTFSPYQLPTPRGVDATTWKKIRRGWWNVLMPCVSGNIGSGPGSVPAPAGVLANNPVSDPVSSAYLFIGDHMLLQPNLAPDISAEYILRYSVDWWLDKRTDPSGKVVSYYDINDMLDAPPSIVVASWACVEMSNDLTWAKARIAELERITDYVASRDIDHDGIIESPKSGNAGTLSRPDDRAATAMDTINSGHKEIYINAFAYRAFCCMADLEKRLQRKDQYAHYAQLANHLRQAFYPTFYSPQTQLLSWWISEDGQRHDYWAPGIIGLPITYGLVPAAQAKQILSRIEAKVKEVGFTRLDIGLPCVLTPIRKADYHLGVGAAYGGPSREDGSDTFQHYLNGGCLVSDQIHWLNAHYRMGLGDQVKPELDAMVARQANPIFPNGGSFQNGIINSQPQGAEFLTWNGQTCGYEGHLVYSWFFLQGVLTQHPEYLKKLVHPITELAHGL